MSDHSCHFTWVEHQETLVSLVQGLYDDESYFDCTLSGGGQHFDVHRLILSSCSPFFNKILQQHRSENPVITLDGVSSVELRALVEYIYTGETSVPPEYLNSFFRTTKSLEIAGLCHYNSEDVNEILNEDESGNLNESEEFKYDYETDSQNILNYLEQSEESPENEFKNESMPVEKNDVNANEEGGLKEEKANVVEGNIINKNSLIYEKYQSAFKEESVDECFTPSIIDNNNLPRSSETDDSMEADDVHNNSILYEKYHNVLIRDDVNDGAIDESLVDDENISKSCKEEEQEDTEYWETSDDVKNQDESENYVYVKLDNNTLQRVRGNQIARIKQERHENMVYSDKFLKVVNPAKKNILIKRPKIRIIASESKNSGDEKKIYICLKCGNKYSHRRTLLHHIHWICDQPATYSCSLCPYMGKRKFQLKSHMKHAHLLQMS